MNTTNRGDYVLWLASGLALLTSSTNSSIMPASTIGIRPPSAARSAGRAAV